MTSPVPNVARVRPFACGGEGVGEEGEEERQEEEGEAAEAGEDMHRLGLRGQGAFKSGRQAAGEEAGEYIRKRSEAPNCISAAGELSQPIAMSYACCSQSCSRSKGYFRLWAMRPMVLRRICAARIVVVPEWS
jgi:hypothetical protein